MRFGYVEQYKVSMTWQSFTTVVQKLSIRYILHAEIFSVSLHTYKFVKKICFGDNNQVLIKNGSWIHWCVCVNTSPYVPINNQANNTLQFSRFILNRVNYIFLNSYMTVQYTCSPKKLLCMKRMLARPSSHTLSRISRKRFLISKRFGYCKSIFYQEK